MQTVLVGVSHSFCHLADSGLPGGRLSTPRWAELDSAGAGPCNLMLLDFLKYRPSQPCNSKASEPGPGPDPPLHPREDSHLHGC